MLGRTMPPDGRDPVPRRGSWDHSCDQIYCHQATEENTAGFVHTIQALDVISPPQNIKCKAVQLQKDPVAAAWAQCCLQTPLLLGPRYFISCRCAAQPPVPASAPQEGSLHCHQARQTQLGRAEEGGDTEAVIKHLRKGDRRVTGNGEANRFPALGWGGRGSEPSLREVGMEEKRILGANGHVALHVSGKDSSTSGKGLPTGTAGVWATGLQQLHLMADGGEGAYPILPAWCCRAVLSPTAGRRGDNLSH